MLKIVLFLIFFFFIIPSKTYAANSDIVINEVLPDPDGSDDTEFIELYNKGGETVTVTGWKLTDTNGSTDIYMLPENTISAGGYKAFAKSATGISLNNDADGVILKDSSDQQIDSMSFNSTSSGKSWSRIPNGIGGFVNNTSPSQDNSNNAPPTPTPTSTPSPTVTPTLSPTNTPTPTPIPTRIPTPTPTNVLTPTPTIKAKATPSPSPKMMTTVNTDTSDPTNQQPKKDVLGDVAMGGKLDDLEPEKQGYNWWRLLIVMGTVIITGTCGVLLYNNHIKERSEELSNTT